MGMYALTYPSEKCGLPGLVYIKFVFSMPFMEVDYDVCFSQDIHTESGMNKFMDSIHYFFGRSKQFAVNWKGVCESNAIKKVRPDAWSGELWEYSNGIETTMNMYETRGRFSPGIYKGVIVIAISNPTWKPVNSSQLFAKGQGPCRAVFLFDQMKPIGSNILRNWIDGVSNEFKRAFQLC